MSDTIVDIDYNDMEQVYMDLYKLYGMLRTSRQHLGNINIVLDQVFIKGAVREQVLDANMTFPLFQHITYMGNIAGILAEKVNMAKGQTETLEKAIAEKIRANIVLGIQQETGMTYEQASSEYDKLTVSAAPAIQEAQPAEMSAEEMDIRKSLGGLLNSNIKSFE